MLLNRRMMSCALAAISLFAAACGSDSTGPSAPLPILGLNTTAKGAASVQLTFNSVAGDDSYDIERAEGATGGTFALIINIAAPSTPGLVTYVDNGLNPTTVYRYRVITVKGSLRSSASGEASTSTLAFGNAVADITTDITASRTLYADTVYTLKGFIHVANNSTLTIQPGTKIVGDFTTLGSSLWILRGSKIQAVGTAAAPIVFTSSRTTGRQPGDWGGLLIVGNAINNRVGPVEVEGSGTDGTTVVGGKNYQVLYSDGSVATDNSGTLSYVRVEFAGFAPSLNNELNSFTFAAVGSGTRASFLQTMGGLDDSYEFFGGGFDADHLVAYETGDDMFDMSEGFVGRLAFLIGFNSPPQLTPRTGAGSLATDLEGIENDGCNGSGCTNGFNQTPYTVPLVTNFTLVGCASTTCVGSGGGFGMMLRRGTGGFYANGVVARFPNAGISLRDAATYDRGGAVAVPDPATSDLLIRNIYFTDVNGTLFQAGGGSTIQNSLDAAGNSLTLGTATAASLFTALPAQGATPAAVTEFDWTPATGSPIATGGLATFPGKMGTKGGTAVAGTAYVGAAQPAGTKWWSGWTVYFRN